LRRGFADHDFLTFALLVNHAEHADAVLILVILWLKLIRCQPIDKTDTKL
jgi:hypothetical protein